MDEKAVRGVPWTLLTYAGNKLFTVATIIVLARLLSPADFGVMAVATLAVTFIGFFGNFGLQATLVLHQDLSERGKGTLLALMLCFGSVMAIALAASAPAMASLFQEPELAGVLAAMSSTLLFGGPRWFYESLMQRELEFRARFGAQIASSVALAAASIALAVAGAGVWSLAGGFIIGGIVHTVALVALAPYRVPLAFERAEARRAVRTGSGFVAQGGLAFLQDNADYIAIGRILGSTQLGFYSMAYRLGELPYYGVADPVAKVTFASFSRMRHQGEDVTRPFLSTLRLIALVTFPLGVVLTAASEPFTRALFGETWLPMIGVLSVLGVWAMIRPTHSTLGWLLNSVGAARLLGAISALTMLVLVPAIVIAADQGGIVTVGWVMLADVTATSLVLAYFVSRRAGVPLRRQWDALKPAVLAAPFSWVATRLVAEATDGLPPALSLTAAVAAAVISFALGASITRPGIIGEAAAQIGRTVGLVPAAGTARPVR